MKRTEDGSLRAGEREQGTLRYRLKPCLTAEITYAEILPGGSLRAGVFRGFASTGKSSAAWIAA